MGNGRLLIKGRTSSLGGLRIAESKAHLGEPSLDSGLLLHGRDAVRDLAVDVFHHRAGLAFALVVARRGLGAPGEELIERCCTLQSATPDRVIEVEMRTFTVGKPFTP